MTLAHGLADALGARIVAGLYDNHQFPTEADLSARTHTSRSVVREAIKMLASKGLVAASPRRGISIRPRETWNLLDPAILRWIERSNPTAETITSLEQIRLAVLHGAAELVRSSTNQNQLVAVGVNLPDPALLLYLTRNPFFAALSTLVDVSINLSGRRTDRRQPAKGAG